MKNRQLYWIKFGDDEFIARYFDKIWILNNEPGFEYGSCFYSVDNTVVIKEATEEELEDQIDNLDSVW